MRRYRTAHDARDGLHCHPATATALREDGKRAEHYVHR